MTLDRENKLPDIYRGLQSRLEAGLNSSRDVFGHPVAKGDSAESNWLLMFQQHLPMRYQAHRAFVVDANGKQSNQLDIVIYDRQYTPVLYNHDGERVIPAESVYAVMEVKQTLDKGNISYAGAKAASVRALSRTSAAIKHAGGKHDPVEPVPIIAGILATDSSWNPPLGGPFNASIGELAQDNRIDLGCCVAAGGFEVSYNNELIIEKSSSDTALAFFFLRLLKRLQQIGTVPAIDYDKYIDGISG